MRSTAGTLARATGPPAHEEAADRPLDGKDRIACGGLCPSCCDRAACRCFVFERLAAVCSDGQHCAFERLAAVLEHLTVAISSALSLRVAARWDILVAVWPGVSVAAGRLRHQGEASREPWPPGTAMRMLWCARSFGRSGVLVRKCRVVLAVDAVEVASSKVAVEVASSKEAVEVVFCKAEVRGNIYSRLEFDSNLYPLDHGIGSDLAKH